MISRNPVVRIVDPGRLEPGLGRALAALEKDTIVRRIWARDWTIWKPVDTEISDRLGWLSLPVSASESVPDLEAFAASIRGQGLTQAVVLGMGGSSLAPEVFGRLFETAPGALDLAVLDTTEPGTVAAAAARFPTDRTLFIVSSKSGTTAEMLALFSFFYDRARIELGAGHAGSRFIAVTDPGTPLEELARERRFRRTFSAPRDVGGRFSALSAFGLVPAALKGIDLERLLAPARAMAAACRSENVGDNPGAFLGAILGAAANRGVNKLTLVFPAPLRPFAGWLEQLIAESTGKEGQGIVPVIEDRSGPPGSYGDDRLFVEIGPPDAPAPKSRPRSAGGPGSPLLRLSLDGTYDLGGHFFLWEFATAVAARVLGINAFDQPDVESAKKRAREALAEAGRGEGPDRAAEGASFRDGLKVRGPEGPESPGTALKRFLAEYVDRDYLAILAFLPRSPAVEELLSGMAATIRLKTGLPVTVGLGPRYLHSTGQLHKGDGNRGLFLMLIAADLPDLPIPEVPGVRRPAPDFGRLFRAQAAGDALALAEKGRRVLTIELTSPVETGLAALTSFLE